MDSQVNTELDIPIVSTKKQTRFFNKGGETFVKLGTILNIQLIRARRRVRTCDAHGRLASYLSERDPAFFRPVRLGCDCGRVTVLC